MEDPCDDYVPEKLQHGAFASKTSEFGDGKLNIKILKREEEDRSEAQNKFGGNYFNKLKEKKIKKLFYRDCEHIKMDCLERKKQRAADFLANSGKKSRGFCKSSIKLGDFLSDNGKPTCCICSKQFKSMKSLFGHMKCHPERTWRGMQPPPGSGTNSSLPEEKEEEEEEEEELDDDEEDEEIGVDLLKFLPKWSKTAKRCQRIVVGECVHEDYNYNCSSLPEDCINPSKKLKIESNDQESEYCEWGDSDWGRKDGKTEESDSENTHSGILGQPRMINTNCNMKLEAVGRFQCSTCFKCFSTFQALGGHRSSHNKAKNTQPSRADECDQDQNIDSMVDGSSKHICNICNKSFQTGQALGGHKRRHWTGPVEAAAPSSEVASVGDPKIASPGEASQSGPKRVLNFDLNEFPPMEDEEEGIEGAGFNSICI